MFGNTNIMNMKKMMNLNYLITYFVGAIASTLLTPYLKELGFDEIQKGIILSGIAILTLFSQFISGYLCDKFKKIRDIRLCEWSFIWI